jgi:hypothetical protein
MPAEQGAVAREASPSIVVRRAFGFERQGEAGLVGAPSARLCTLAHPFGTSFLDAREAKIHAKDLQERGVGVTATSISLPLTVMVMSCFFITDLYVL